MFDFHSILKDNLYGVLATDDKGKPKTRIIQYLFSIGDKVYFGTTNNKPTYQQLSNNPYVSFCSHKSDYSVFLTIDGKVNFVNDLSLKERAMEDYPDIKAIYKSPDNPIFEIFFIDIETVKTFGFKNGERIYQLS